MGLFALLYVLLSLSDMVSYVDGAVLYPFRRASVVFFFCESNTVHRMFTKINKNDENRDQSSCFVSV